VVGRGLEFGRILKQFVPRRMSGDGMRLVVADLRVFLMFLFAAGLVSAQDGEKSPCVVGASGICIPEERSSSDDGDSAGIGRSRQGVFRSHGLHLIPET